VAVFRASMARNAAPSKRVEGDDSANQSQNVASRAISSRGIFWANVLPNLVEIETACGLRMGYPEATWIVAPLLNNSKGPNGPNGTS
jgi:hypothetical protein